VLRPIAVNEPIMATKLAGEGLGPSIAYLLPDGMRAAAVRINDVSGVAGFVQPMDTVDVLITRSLPEGNRQVTDLLLQAVKVIAIDQNATGADGKPVHAKTATLEVNPMDAQKLALAQTVGSLSLVLRKPGEDQDLGRVATVSLNDLRYSYYGGARPMPAVATGQPAPRATVASAPRRVIIRRPAPSAPPRPATNNVEVVRGTTGSNYEVGGYGS
jgi:pilus assembly protein CpaB